MKKRGFPLAYSTALTAGSLYDGFDRRDAAALLTAAREDFTSVLSAHSGTKTMDASSAALFGLIGSLCSHIVVTRQSYRILQKLASIHPFAELFNSGLT